MNFKHIPAPDLLSERLLLRMLKKEDLDFIHRLRTDVENRRFIDRPIPKSKEETKAHLDMVMEGVSSGTFYNWTICLKEDEIPIGNIGVWQFSEDRKTAELGYELVPDQHRNGFMSESIAVVLPFCFEVLQLDNVHAVTHELNKASITLLNKFGFQHSNNPNSEEDSAFKLFIKSRPSSHSL